MNLMIYDMVQYDIYDKENKSNLININFLHFSKMEFY